MNLHDLSDDVLSRAFSQEGRPVRLRFAGQAAAVFDDVLVPQRVEVCEGICEGSVAHITCLTTRNDLPLDALQGLPIEVGIVTDQGELRRFDVVVTEVRQGQSDGSLTVVQLTGVDILTLMDGRRSNRVFLNLGVLDIARRVLDGWRRRSPAVARAFDHALQGIDESRYPPRALTFQAHQSDAEFLRSLLARNGISWFFRPAADASAEPAQLLVLFDDARQLAGNSAGTIRYHRRDGTEPRDTVSLLAPVHTLVGGRVVRSSWDHETARVDVVSQDSGIDQGEVGNLVSAALVDARIELPHAGDSFADHERLTRIDMQRSDSRARRLHGIGGVRAQAVAEWNRIDGHALLDTLAPEERDYITVQLRQWCENSLPKELADRAQALLAGSESALRDRVPPSGPRGQAPDSAQRYVNQFIAVRRDVPIVPAWDPQADLPRMAGMSATVVGPEGQDVYCDGLGRVKLRIHGLDRDDASNDADADTDTEADTAWVRVNFLWAGEGFGIIFPLRVGMEVILEFEHGDPSRPMIVGSRYNVRQPPPRFDHLGSLPANAALSGIVTREWRGGRQQQLRFNDSTGDISTQLASDHAASQLNLGSLATPMRQGQTTPRGEGAELRSDAASSLRGGQGVLISSAAQPGANGHQLARDELLGLAQTLQAIVEQLGALATTHHASGTDPARFGQLVRHLKDWELGSNTAPEQGPGGAPIVAVSAVAGAGIVSQDNLVLGAQTHVDIVSAGHTQTTAGQQIRQRAATGVSTFAHTGGIEAIAGKGLVDIQAQQGSVQLTASDTITLTAGVKVIIQAPEVQIIGQGTQTQWAGGSIVEQARNAVVVRSARFAHTSAGDGVPAGVTMPSSTLRTDEQFILFNQQNGKPLVDRGYRATLDDGQVIEGRTDAQGRTQLSQADGAIRLIELFILPPGR